MELGDFTSLAASYGNRAGYSELVLGALAKYTGAFERPDFKIADVGAGTGKLTENIFEMGLSCVCVEPNDSMREEGKVYTAKFPADWRKGSGEETGLPSASIDWLFMASSFHWVDLRKGLAEFHRVLKPGGFFTALWNPRNLEASPLHTKIESRVFEIAPNIKRVSSGGAKYRGELQNDMISTGQFSDCLFVEANHEVAMSKERYLGAWRSVNDIQVQAGPERFEQIMLAIEAEIKELPEVIVPYKTRSWTVRRVN